MSVIFYVVMKAVFASVAVAFQALLPMYADHHDAGAINEVQVQAMILSMMIFPGIEFSIVRTFPLLKHKHPEAYTNTVSDTVTCSTILLVLLSGVLFLLLTFSSEKISVIMGMVGLSLLFAYARVIPSILRADGLYIRSILSEPGVIFLSGVATLAFVPKQYWPNAFDFWMMVTATAAFCYAIPNLTGNVRKITNRTRSVISASRTVWKDYGFQVVLVSVSNFSLLWVPAAVSTLVMSNQEVFETVSALRLIGLLIFSEGALAAYFVPKFVHRKKDVRSFVAMMNRYRVLLTGSTFVISAAMFIGLSVHDPFTMTITGYIGLVLVVIAQIVVCGMASPFSIVVAIGTKEEITGICVTILSLAAISAVVVAIVPDVIIVLSCFSILQVARATLGGKILRRYMER